jgi:N-acetylmuramoyl-L-alanine amidase
MKGPTNYERRMIVKIMIDAGHSYKTPGKRSPNGMREYEFNRSVASFLKNLLGKYQDVDIYFSHSDKQDVPLKLRTDGANALQVDVFISIHANAYGQGNWNDVCGIESYVYVDKPKTSLALAKVIQKKLIAETGLKDRGVKTANFHVLRETTCPSVLIECGFMTNHKEAILLGTDLYRKKCAEAIAIALEQFYSLKKI